MVDGSSLMPLSNNRLKGTLAGRHVAEQRQFQSRQITYSDKYILVDDGPDKSVLSLCLQRLVIVIGPACPPGRGQRLSGPRSPVPIDGDPRVQVPQGYFPNELSHTEVSKRKSQSEGPQMKYIKREIPS